MQRILQEIMKKKIILATSDAWSTSHLSQQTSILYCRLSNFLSRDCFSLLVSCFSDSAASSCSFIWPCNFLFSSFRPLVESKKKKNVKICSPCSTFSQQIVLLISMFKDYYNSSSPWHGWLVNKLQQITRQLCYFRKIKYPNQLGNYTLNKCESLIKLGSYLLVFRRKTIS